MNTYKYIALGIIGLSAGGIQGMSWMRCAQKSYVPQLTQFAQKLSSYRYHIGVALTLAVLYGGYRLLKKPQQTVQDAAREAWMTRNSGPAEAVMVNPYKIEYEMSGKTYDLMSPIFTVKITSILFDNQRLVRDEVQSVSWGQGQGKACIDNFVVGLRSEVASLMSINNLNDVLVQVNYNSVECVASPTKEKGLMAVSEKIAPWLTKVFQVGESIK